MITFKKYQTILARGPQKHV